VVAGALFQYAGASVPYVVGAVLVGLALALVPSVAAGVSSRTASTGAHPAA
jgi:hypothetical protein